VSGIIDPKRRLINYAGTDGDSLKGLIVLPAEYVPGRRYPLIAFVYPLVMVKDTTTLEWLFSKQFVSALNIGLIPAHGYALLIPSVPMTPEGEAGDPMIQIPKGVVAAVDEAVRVGIADPARLGVMGHSFGGYSVYSIVAYTHRFRAAVALAGAADLPSLYGDFEPTRRHSEVAVDVPDMDGLIENGQLRMGTHPWGDLWRYLRNSPVFFADRITTSLMIIQGDMDFISMGQGEEMFSALYRMGKPAKFVRYWGEGHMIERSPANVRDMWRRVFDFFDTEMHGRRDSTGRAAR
jgi:dipeptidyl aminopeptidase/acylaminoacyl peptidase